MIMLLHDMVDVIFEWPEWSFPVVFPFL
jgi:hypothetical protein